VLRIGGGAAAAVAGATALDWTTQPASGAPLGDFVVGSAPVPLNQPADPLIGLLAPAADAPERGMFAPEVPWPVIPIHIAVSRSGHLVSFGTPLDSAAQGGLVYDDWDVAAGFGRRAHAQSASMHDYNSFCNGFVTLDDGSMLMVGGNSTMNTMVYDPVTGKQTMGVNLAYQRWYATALRRPDDRVLVLGGADYYNTGAYLQPQRTAGVAMVPELGTGRDAWTALPGAASPLATGPVDNHWWYPRAFNGLDGNVLGMSGDQVWRMSTEGQGSITRLAQLPFNPRISGSQVMFAPGRILVAGGGQPVNDDGTVSTAAAAVVDATGASVQVRPTSPMAANRNWLNLTVLPTGEVLANGGTRIGTWVGEDNSVKTAEIWNPTTGTWRPAARAARTRTYHSTAVLLPSGAVFTGGGGAPGPEDNLNAELYYPPSLFTRGPDGVVRWADRPRLTTIAGSAVHGGSLKVTLADARQVAAASLISMGSVTHSLNLDQRRIPLTFTQQGATLSMTLPTDINLMPPGDYLLTVLDAAGVPSPGQILTLRNGRPGTVTVNSAIQVSGLVPATEATEGSVPLTVGTRVGLEPTNFRDHRLQHENFGIVLRRASAASSAAVRLGTSWTVRAGLASAADVSFESVDWPGWFLTAPIGPGAVAMARDDGTPALRARMTFVAVRGATGQNTSLQVFNQPAMLLRHQDFVLRSAALDGSDLARADSTFAVRPALAEDPTLGLVVGTRVGLEGSAWPGYRIQHENYGVVLRQVGAASPAWARAGTTWIVRPGLVAGTGVSLESADLAGWFLTAAAGPGFARLIRDDGSALLRQRMTFLASTGVSGRGVSLRVFDQPAMLLRHQNFVLGTAPLAATDGGRADATWVVRPGLA
jgi:hypothetical protein